jgi:hypothetical protein
MTAANVIEDTYHYLISLVQKFGWFIVAIAIAVYFSYPFIQKKMRELAIHRANDPYRRAILDEDRKKVRKIQQQELSKLS